MSVTIQAAIMEQAAAIAALHNAAADELTRRHGTGPWSGQRTERGVRYDFRHGQVYVALLEGNLAGTFVFATKKPWAIDRKFFTPCARPMYLTGMAVAPAWQRRGIGRLCLQEAQTIARKFPANSICLDAWDAAAGAGEFYRKCGFREVGRASFKGVPLVYYEMMV